MKISNELLAAYAEGNVSTEERNVVRQRDKTTTSNVRYAA